MSCEWRSAAARSFWEPMTPFTPCAARALLIARTSSLRGGVVAAIATPLVRTTIASASPHGTIRRMSRRRRDTEARQSTSTPPSGKDARAEAPPRRTAPRGPTASVSRSRPGAGTAEHRLHRDAMRCRCLGHPPKAGFPLPTSGDSLGPRRVGNGRGCGRVSMRVRKGCDTVSIGGGLAARRGEVRRDWRAARGASAVLAAGAGSLAAPAAGATAPPLERSSATAGGILPPARSAAGGISTVFAWETPVAMRGYRFPDDGSLVRIGSVAASAERGSGDAVAATGSAVLRSVELFGGMLRIDVVRARASLRASDGAVADTSVSHVVNVRLDGDSIELVPGKKLWVKGWGYAVVDDPVSREDSTGAGDTLAALRLHLTSARSGLPA